MIVTLYIFVIKKKISPFVVVVGYNNFAGLPTPGHMSSAPQ